MFCSTIIPTIGRPSLSKAVMSILNQSFQADDFEVIIVNDSGFILPKKKWMEIDCVHVINTNRRNRSVARNAGAAIARGSYLHFLDDDDWMIEDSFENLWYLVNKYKAAWVFGGYRMVDNKGALLEECFPDETGNCYLRFMSGEWLPLQASLINSDAFFSVGGFESLDSLRGGNEDVDLSRKISLFYDIAGTNHIVAEIRVGRDGSTTNYIDLHEQSMISREKSLAATGSHSRLIDSAKTRSDDVPYWFGRITWIYLVSVWWNLRERRILSALSRLSQLALSIFITGRFLLAYSYWAGATRPHKASGWLSTEL